MYHSFISHTKRTKYDIDERFLSCILKEYGSHPVSTPDSGTWYPQACRFLKLVHPFHILLLKNTLLKEQCIT